VLAPDGANILKVVLGGVPARGGYIPMPPFAAQLNDQQIADIANYLRTSWGNAAPANVTPQMVASLRGTLPASTMAQWAH
jgi:mono/diheme cytochrome c family protein